MSDCKLNEIVQNYFWDARSQIYEKELSDEAKNEINSIFSGIDHLIKNNENEIEMERYIEKIIIPEFYGLLITLIIEETEFKAFGFFLKTKSDLKISLREICLKLCKNEELFKKIGDNLDLKLNFKFQIFKEFKEINLKDIDLINKDNFGILINYKNKNIIYISEKDKIKLNDQKNKKENLTCFEFFILDIE